MEVLTDILKGLRATGSVYFCDFMAPPWEAAYDNEDRAIFHLVRRGRCEIRAGGGVHSLEPGDFAFLAPHVAHQLACNDIEAPETLLLCGYCEFSESGSAQLLRSLPDFVLIRSDELQELPWLKRTLEHLSAEYMSGAPGSELTVDKLTEVLLVQLLRVDFGRSTDVGIAAALNDKRIARALTEIHTDPGRHWTLALAADVASMSRAAFAKRFKDLLQQSFLQYLTSLRMRHARNLLTESGLPVPHIAERVGYQSAVSFVNTFKKLHGETPRAYRVRSR